MKSLYYIIPVIIIIFLNSNGFTHSIKESDIIYGKDETDIYLCLSQWDHSLKQDLSDLKIPDKKIKELKDILDDYRRKLIEKEYKEVYCRAGFIRRDFYFILKLKKTAKSRFENIGILLAAGLKPLPPKKPPAVIQKIKLNTFNILIPGDIPPDIRMLYNIGKGYTLKMDITVTGSNLFESQKKEIEDIAAGIRFQTGEEMLRILIDLGKIIVTRNPGIAELKAIIADTDKRLRTAIMESAINLKVEEAVINKLNEDSMDSRIYPDWKVNCSAKSELSTLKPTKECITLCITGGTDSTAYLSIASRTKKILSIIAAISSNEEKLRRELNSSIDNFIHSSEGLISMINKVYTENQINETSTLKNIIYTASSGETQAQNYLYALVRLKILGQTLNTADCEEKLSGYRSYISTARDELEKELIKFMQDEEQFKVSRMDKTDRHWSEIQKINKHCTYVMEQLAENDAYSERIKEKLTKLSITVSEDTSLAVMNILFKNTNCKNISEMTKDRNMLIARSAADIKKKSDIIEDKCRTLREEVALL